MKDLEGKVAIVLGASTPGGMGQAMARRLNAAGARVVVSGLGAQNLAEFAKELGGSAFEADITQESQLAALVAHAVEKYGRLDIAINAAGIAPRVPFRELSEEHLMQVARVHFVGPAMFIKHVANVIVDGGAIVNISSIAGYEPIAGMVGYAASKRAGDRVIQGAAVEYRHKRLRINAIVPALVLTELARKEMPNFGVDPVAFERGFVELTPLGRIAQPEDIAAMAYMMVRDEFFETGQILHCSGGITLLGQPRSLALGE